MGEMSSQATARWVLRSPSTVEPSGASCFFSGPKGDHKDVVRSSSCGLESPRKLHWWEETSDASLKGIPPIALAHWTLCWKRLSRVWLSEEPESMDRISS